MGLDASLSKTMVFRSYDSCLDIFTFRVKEVPLRDVFGILPLILHRINIPQPFPGLHIRKQPADFAAKSTASRPKF